MSVRNTAYCSCVLMRHCGTRVLCVKDETSVLCGRFGGELRDRHVLCDSSELHFIMAVCSQIHTKHTNTLCGQNVELYLKTQPVPRSKHSPSRL